MNLKTKNQKPKTNFGFTFVEVMISISIMALFSVVGISSFEKFFKSSQMLNIKSKILNIITLENNKLVSGDISSYKIIFMTGSRAILINENYYKNPQIIKLDNFDFVNLSGSLSTNNTSTGEWIVGVSADGMLIVNQYLNGSGALLGLDFSSNNDFEKLEISSTIDKIKTNKIILERIDFSGNETDNVQETLIYSLSGSELYNKASIENIMGNKKVLVSTGANPEQEYNGNIDLNISRGNQDLTFKLEK
ncbi:MAG: prepilin-type N-terminal cleavage/methylation domain-containing protein [Candidatus Gracilibacteria bacterium]|nr:prepilin-type N-terminal cleavage/methylation domain-containing protein [Candidatus Gracilibacteria bacterium]MDD2908822.1 prepilin-type N-terminal cleavage/methylation domain-containing protein [Candidatus Gracilibacteria bacterium]